jgi:hypothetical protein
VNCLEGICCKSSWHYCSVVFLRGDTRIAWRGYAQSSWHYCSVVDFIRGDNENCLEGICSVKLTLFCRFLTG